MQNGRSLIASCTLAFLLLLQGCNNSSQNTAQSPEASLAAQAGSGNCTDVGGSMVMTWKDDVSTLDPAIGYDWQNWSMIKSLFGRLLDYEPGTTELKPDLAESYEISEDGLTYTFKLRPATKFHNRRAVTAEDVKGLDIGIFMAGAVVVESVFGWPGLGQLTWQAIQIVDIPVIYPLWELCWEISLLI